MTRNREWEAGKCVGKRLTENRETDCTIFEKILLVTTNRGCGKMHLCSCDMSLSLSLALLSRHLERQLGASMPLITSDYVAITCLRFPITGDVSHACARYK